MPTRTKHHPLLLLCVGMLCTALRATAAESVAPANDRVFAIWEYWIEGNTLLSQGDIERAVTGYLGEGRSIKDVEEARRHLEQLYHDRGYKTVLVNIPEQSVSSGIVQLKVTEASVGKLKVVGSKYHDLEAIRGKFTQLNPDAVPKFDEVQKELAEANRSPDMHVTPVLRASETPGRVDVDLDVTDTLPAHALVEVNNRYSPNTSHLRATGELRYDNLFQSGQSVNLQYQIAPEYSPDTKVGSLSYVVPTQGPLAFAFYAVHSDSNVAAVGGVDVIGKGNIFGARLIDSLPSTGPWYYHNLTLGLDYKDFQQTTLLQAATSSIQTPVSYPLFSAQYSFTWLGAPANGDGTLIATPGGRTSTSLDLGLSFAVRGLGVSATQFAAKRYDADPAFIVFHPALSRQQVLWGHWSIYGRIEGQLASGPLINNEQFAAGGVDSVRGYAEAERLGDEGVRASVELRTPQLLVRRLPWVTASYLFAFADAAHLAVIEPLPNQAARYDLASTGLGLHFNGAGLSMQLSGARILKDGYTSHADRLRGNFSLSYTY